MPFLNTARCWCGRNILLPVTVCFMVGILVGHAQPPRIPERAAVIVFLLLAALALYIRKQQLALFLSLPLFLLAGYLHVLHQLDLPKTAGHIAALIQEQRQVTLVGTLASMAETGTVRTEDGEEIISRFELDAEEVRIEQHWQAVRGRVRLSVPGRADDLLPGASLMILAQIGPPSRFNTPGSFDYPAHLAAEDIYLSGWVSSRQDMLAIAAPPKTSWCWSSLRAHAEQTRQQVALFLRQHLEPAVFGTYQALLIGSQTAVSPELLERFQATGTTHILSISGLHISLLALLLGTLLDKLLRRSRWLLLRRHVPSLALLGTLPLLLAYAVLAGLNTPVLRALIMAAILQQAVLLGRQHSLLHLLAAAALLVLALNPLALFTASFQLSFSAVAALILFLPKLLPQTEQSSLLARSLMPPLLASIAATAGTLPLVLLHFHRFSIIGPLLNLAVEPLLCFWALPWGLAAIPCLFVCPQLAAALLKIGSLSIAAGQWCVGQGAALPWASVWMITPSNREMLAYFLLLLLWSLRCRKAALAGAALLILHFTWGLWLPEQPGSSKVAVLDVGQGLSTFLLLPDGSRILVDGGTSSKALDIGQQVIGPYLWSQRVWRLDQAVISHPHADHFSGMDFILRHFHPKVLWINGDAHREANYQEIVDMAAQQGTAVLIPASGRRLAQGKDFALTVIGSFPGADVNNASLALRCQHGRRAFLLPGDIGTASEDLLLRHGVNVQADVLLAGHHGSSTSTGSAFLAAVQPQLLVVSAGRGSRQQYFPAQASRALWQEKNIPVLITREAGAVICVSDGEGLECGSVVGAKARRIQD